MNPAAHSRKTGCLWLLLTALAISPFARAATWQEQVLYSFQGGSDGAVPAGGVVFDRSGNLYGATTDGNQYGELGVVYELSPPAKKGDPWTESLIYQFLGKKDYNDGMNPVGGLVIDGAGNLYGTTAYGGSGGCILLGVLYGCGTVYELSPPRQKGGQWTEAILYSFQGDKDGYFPWGTLTFDAKGNLYGATQFGGGKGNTCNEFYGGNCGTVFEMSPPKQQGGHWTERVLHSFAGGADGANPNGGPVLDTKGAIYGTTFSGGNQGCKTSYSLGCGAVFKLGPTTTRGSKWTEKLLHTFTGNSDGAAPDGNLIFDGSGGLYGCAGGGGGHSRGVVFHLVAHRDTWSISILYDFLGNRYGQDPTSGLLRDANGNLYGESGGGVGGLVYRLKRSNGRWSFAALYDFGGNGDGDSPAGGLERDSSGDLFGTTLYGGTGQNCGTGGCGTAFQVSP